MAWECPYAEGAALEMAKRQKKKRIKLVMSTPNWVHGCKNCMAELVPPASSRNDVYYKVVLLR